MPVPITKPGRAMDGHIAELWRGRSCGFIRTTDAQTVFFHARDLERLKYNDLQVTLGVTFELIEDAVSGPRAARIRARKAEGRPKAKTRGARPAPEGRASASR